MTLDYLPARLPSMERIKYAARDALEHDLAEALAYVSQQAVRMGGPDLTLPPPERVRVATVRDYQAVTRWPSVTIETETLSPRYSGEQRIIGALTGGLGIDCWLQYPDPEALDIALDRYAAAVWTVLVNHDPLGGAELDPQSVQITPDPNGGTRNRRVVHLSLDLIVRV